MIYRRQRNSIATEALRSLRQDKDMKVIGGFISIVDAVKLASSVGITYSALEIQDDVSRGIIEGERIEGNLCVYGLSFLRMLNLKC